MATARRRALGCCGCLLAAALAGGCSRPADPSSAGTPQAATPAPASIPAPTGRSVPAAPPVATQLLPGQVWSVTESNAVAPGTLYVFLADGSLVVSSPGSRVAVGTWQRDPAAGLTMVEESRPYAVDVLELTPQRLRLRSHNPGPPVDLTLAPAAQPPAPVPERFRGEWNAKLQECGQAGGEARLRIGADTIRFHETAGSLRAVLPQGDRALALVARLEGEGEARLAYRHYRLSADGRTLADISAGDSGALVRQRCPAK